MPIKITCTKCTRVILAKEEFAGKRVRCPNPECKEIMQVPVGTNGAGSAPAPPAAKPAPQAQAKPVAPQAPSAKPPATPPTPPVKNGTPPPAAPPGTKPPAPKSPAAKPPVPKAQGVSPPPAKPPIPKSVGVSPPPPPPPAPIPEPEVDADALAAEALAEPKAEAAPPDAGDGIEFVCMYCDAKVKAAFEMAGKQMPCTNDDCRMIVKVPIPEKKDLPAWRAAEKKHALAKVDTSDLPDGVWGSSNTESVHKQSLQEAGLIAQPKRAATLGVWILRGLAAAVLVQWTTLLLLAQTVGAKHDKLLRLALEQVSADGVQAKLNNEREAAIHLGIGEYYLHSRSKNSLTKAREHLLLARNLVSNAKPSLDRDLLLLAIAGQQIELGGSFEEVQLEQKLPWDKVQSEVLGTLDLLDVGETPVPLLRTVGARATGLRAVCDKLLAKQQYPLIVSLLAPLQSSSPAGCEDEWAELLAAVGLDLLQAEQPKWAGRLAELAQKRYPQPLAGELPLHSRPIAPSLVVLYLKLGEDKKATELRAKPTSPTTGDAFAKLAYAENELASFHQLLLALKWLPKDTEPEPARWCELVAAKTKAGDVPHAWLLLRLAHFALTKDADTQLSALASEVKDPSLRGQLQLLVLQHQLRAKKISVADAAQFTVEPESFAFALSRLELARYGAKQSSKFRKEVERWDVTHRPFGYVGLALAQVE